MKKKGISLIVLVITIIVLIILATAIIVSLARNNPVENSKEATFKSDLANIKDLVNLASTDILLEKEGASYKGIIPEEYEKKVYIHEGVLYYKGEPGQEEEWAKEVDVLRRKDIPDDWIDIAESTPENGISLLIGKPELEEATIKFKVTATGAYNVDWGDGSSSVRYVSESEASHTYSTNSDKSSTDGYLFQINITPDSGREITQFEHVRIVSSPLLWCQVGCDTLTDCTNMFTYATNLKKFGTASKTSLKNVTNTQSMFYNCKSLTSIPELDTSNATYMGSMFALCSSLTSISGVDTSNAENTHSMFYDCRSLEEIPELNTSNVTYMFQMFSGCSKLKAIQALDTGKVTNMQDMFHGCRNLTKIPELNTSNVISMKYMFYDCGSLTEISLLDTSQVENMYGMFSRCSSLETISKLDTRKVTDMSGMFSECYNLKSINIANTNLTKEQIDNVFDRLPTSKNNSVINITGNPGESDCTRTKATDKGWTIIP